MKPQESGRIAKISPILKKIDQIGTGLYNGKSNDQKYTTGIYKAIVYKTAGKLFYCLGEDITVNFLVLSL